MHRLIQSRSSTSVHSPVDEVISADIHQEANNGEGLSTVEELFFTTDIIADPEVTLIPTTTWEGYVTWVSEDRTSFYADLRDKQHMLEPHSVEMDLDEVPAEDQSLVSEGAVFYWIIGRAVNRGQHFSYDDIRFRRLPNWTKERIRQAVVEADEMFGFFKNNPLTK